MTDPETNEVLLNEFADYDDDGLRDLIERVSQIEEMTQMPGWAFYVDLLTHKTVATQRRILNGSCDSFEEYSRETGWIRGVQAAIEAPAVLRAKLEQQQILTDESKLANERETDGQAA